MVADNTQNNESPAERVKTVLSTINAAEQSCKDNGCTEDEAKTIITVAIHFGRLIDDTLCNYQRTAGRDHSLDYTYKMLVCCVEALKSIVSVLDKNQR